METTNLIAGLNVYKRGVKLKCTTNGNTYKIVDYVFTKAGSEGNLNVLAYNDTVYRRLSTKLKHDNHTGLFVILKNIENNTIWFIDIMELSIRVRKNNEVFSLFEKVKTKTKESKTTVKKKTAKKNHDILKRGADSVEYEDGLGALEVNHLLK